MCTEVISNDSVHDRVSATPAIFIDSECPGVGHAYVYERSQIPSAMTM
jgi:hypothetical protein